LAVRENALRRDNLWQLADFRQRKGAKADGPIRVDFTADVAYPASGQWMPQQKNAAELRRKHGGVWELLGDDAAGALTILSPSSF